VLLMLLVKLIGYERWCFSEGPCADWLSLAGDWQFNIDVELWWLLVVAAGTSAVQVGVQQRVRIRPPDPCLVYFPRGPVYPILLEGDSSKGRIHIERRHSSNAQNDAGHFHPGVAEDMGQLQIILAEALALAFAQGQRWHQSRGNCVLNVRFPGIGTTTISPTNPTRIPAGGLRLVAYRTPPYLLITMFPVP
jgi:hypothetical protein